MPLFRFHRGSLEESLTTTVIVRNTDDLACVIALEMVDINENGEWAAHIDIHPYPSDDNHFDPRTGWYTHLVRANVYRPDEMHPVGYLSEPIERSQGWEGRFMVDKDKMQLKNFVNS